MRKITTGEKLQFRELLQMESISLAKAKAISTLIEDEELKTLSTSGIEASEARIKGIQQFINENDIVSMEVN
ncbi:MAG: hypothetical protein APF76_14815 [Desulfitibacter sp. BRH_c19]|nr:MAG: hypothetical protein APF76_14815 [Desulfitibacter sp. BRH_c19]